MHESFEIIEQVQSKDSYKRNCNCDDRFQYLKSDIVISVIVYNVQILLTLSLLKSGKLRHPNNLFFTEHNLFLWFYK